MGEVKFLLGDKEQTFLGFVFCVCEGKSCSRTEKEQRSRQGKITFVSFEFQMQR